MVICLDILCQANPIERDKRMNKICVYAIAKDEAKCAEAWVKSMSAADHIIVLDTGSTDNTVELLRSLGVEVHETTYDYFRFDQARNDSLDLVPDEYNIRVCTDLDERFENDDWADILRQSWDPDRPRAVYHYVWNHTADGKPGLQFDINKIHGNDPNLRWAGAVHEHLTFMDTGKREFTKFIDLRKQITLHHYADLSKDRKFYMRLAEKRIIENPNDSQAYILLGNEYRAKGSPARAVEIYKQVLDKFSDELDTVEQAAVYYALGSAYYKNRDAVNAMAAFSNGIAIHKTYRDNYIGLAIIYVNNNMNYAAVGLLEEALRHTKQEFFWMEDSQSSTYIIYDVLGTAYFNIGEISKALAAAACALSYEPSNQILQSNYNRYLQTLK